MEGTNQSSFWQFSDNLRGQTTNLSNLSLNDSIWSANYAGKRNTDERRNFDYRNGDVLGSISSNLADTVNDMKSDYNMGFKNDVWKVPSNDDVNSLVNYSNNISDKSNLNPKFPGFESGFNRGVNDDINSLINYSNNMSTYPNYSGNSSPNPKFSKFGSGLNGGFNKGVYYTPNVNFNSYSKGKGFANTVVSNGKVNSIGGKNEVEHVSKFGKKNRVVKESNKDSNGESKSGVDKRFKTLPASETLPRNETIGGYIFVCNNDTMAENLKRELWGLPPRYRDSVRAIVPGLPLFLYNYSTHQLHGIFQATSFGGSNIDPSAWEDKKNPGESRFPAQVRVVTKKVCEPLEEDSFRPILHHYDGPKFRLELSVPEALALLDVFDGNNA